MGVCQALLKQRSQSHPVVPPTPTSTPSSSSGRNHWGCWQLLSAKYLYMFKQFQTHSSCLQFGKAACHDFGTETGHSSTGRGHLGAKGNEGTLFQPSNLLLIATEPAPSSRGGKQDYSWDRPPGYGVTQPITLKPKFCRNSASLSSVSRFAPLIQKSILPAGMSHNLSWTHATTGSLWRLNTTVNRNLRKNTPVAAKWPRAPVRGAANQPWASGLLWIPPFPGLYPSLYAAFEQ